MTKKIIACLDIKDGRVTKGVRGVDFKDAGDPAEAAAHYSKTGADELVFLDITATIEGRGLLLDVLRRTSAKVGIPLTVGGGIRSVEDAVAVTDAGADKVSVGSAAVERPELIAELSRKFHTVAAIDAKAGADGKSYVCTHGGHTLTELDVVAWAVRCEELGASEILLTSFDADGTKEGYDLPLTRAVADAVSIPVTASGGAGSLEDIYDGLTEGGAQNALVASLFHFGEFTIPQVKEYLHGRGVEVKL